MVTPDDYPQTSYLHDLPNIVLSSVSGYVSADIYLGSAYISEKYYPDSSAKVTISSLDDFCADYFDFDYELKTQTSNFPYVKELSVGLRQNGSSSYNCVTCDVYPCKELFGAVPNYRFYTRCHNKIYCDEPFILSFLGGPYKLRLTTYYPTGTYVNTPRSGSSTTTSLSVFKFQRSNFSAGIYMIKADLLAPNDSVVDTVIINFEDKPLFSRTFLFDNVFYAPETVTFRGSEKNNHVVESEYGRIDGKFSKLTNDSYPEYVINSGPLTEDEYQTALDLLTADHVYLIDGSDLIPVVVTNFETNHKDPKDAPSSITMTYRLSERPRVKLTQASEPSGIFDSHFTKVFD